MTKIKICGITNWKDAEAAVSLGADALGFNFFEKSPRYIATDRAREIIARLPQGIWRAGIFVNAPRDAVQQIAHEAKLDTLQFAGDEDAEFCQDWLGFRVCKVIHCTKERIDTELPRFLSIVDCVFFDRFESDLYGGTGKTIPPHLLPLLRKSGAIPSGFLSGGLIPENVAGLVKDLRPCGVDVASGVESSPGIKDEGKMRDFIDAVRSCD